MIDHITLPITNYAQNKPMYDAVFASVGWSCLHAGEQYAGYGIDRPIFWIAEPLDERGPSKNAHIAMLATSKEQVDAFHKSALEQGWKDNGAPGLRPDYGDDYYGAFVLDQDGNNLEFVYRG